MAKVRNYSELLVWQEAMNLVDAVYEMSRAFPREEMFGLTSQLRRAAVSVPCNIAEGQGRTSTKEFMHHLSIAYGSLREVETLALIAKRQKLVTDEMLSDVLDKAGTVGRLANGLMRSLASR